MGLQEFTSYYNKFGYVLGYTSSEDGEVNIQTTFTSNFPFHATYIVFEVKTKKFDSQHSAQFIKIKIGFSLTQKCDYINRKIIFVVEKSYLLWLKLYFTQWSYDCKYISTPSTRTPIYNWVKKIISTSDTQSLCSSWFYRKIKIL